MTSLEFGCLCPPISEQLDKIGVVYDNDRIADFQKDVDAINHLKMRHLFPKSQLDTAYDKLAKRVLGHIRKPTTAIDEVI